MLTHSADRPQASLGDVVELRVVVEAAGPLDPVLVRVTTPLRGFEVLPGQASATVDASGAVSHPLLGPDFAETIDRSAQQVTLGPFHLAPGATLHLAYRARVGLEARSGSSYTFTAQLLDPSGFPLFDAAAAAVRVGDDPILDQGLVLGRVVCDGGGRGVMGARVYVDTGSYARTDETGKFHLSQLAPGIHLVKLDAASLPPGSKLTGPDAHVVYLMRGLTMRVRFTASCPLLPTVGPDRVVLSEAARAKLPPPARVSTTVTGSLAGMSAEVDGKPVRLPSADLEILADPALLMVPQDGGPPNLSAPRPRFRLRYAGEAAARRWELTIWREGAVVRAWSGKGAPGEVAWDGLDAQGRPARKASVYEAQLRVEDEEGGEARSPRRAFGVAYRGGVGGQEETWRGNFFTGEGKKPRPTDALRAKVKELAGRLAAGETVTVEVHDDGTGDRLLSVARTQRQAEQVKALLVAAGVDAARISARGRGSLAPLAGTGTPESRAQNRRIVVTVRGASAAKASAQVPPPAPLEPSALVAGQAARVAADGRFTKNVPIPLDGRLVIDLEAPDGRRAMRVVELPPPPGAPPRPLPRTVTISGDVAARTLSVDGVAVDTALLAVDVSVGEAAGAGGEPTYRAAKGALDRPISFLPVTPPGWAPATWELTVRPEASAEPIYRASGAGPPDAMTWSGADARGRFLLKNGIRYQAQLSVSDGKGNRGQSPERPFTVGTSVRGAFAPVSVAGPLFRAGGALAPAVKRALADFVAATHTRSAREVYRIEVRIAIPAGANPAEARLATAARLGKLKAFLRTLAAPEGRTVIDVAPIVDPGAQREGLTITASEAPVVARAVIDGQEVKLEGTLFARSLTVRPGAGVMVDVTAPTGQRAVWVFAAGAPAASTPPPPPPSALAIQPGEPEARALEAALSAAPALPSGVAAADLQVRLPPRGQRLPGGELWVSGRTRAGNQVTLNGAPAAVRPDGSFDAVVGLPAGASTLVVTAADPEGNLAAIDWPVEVAETHDFLLLLAEGVASTARSLDEMTDETTGNIGDLVLHGRIAIYYKARVAASKLLPALSITGHLDTAKERASQDFFQDVIDPTHGYPVFGDSADEVRDVNARGKLYLAIDADKARALIGDFHTDLGPPNGLFRYDRTVYGGEIAARSDVAGATEIKAFGAPSDEHLARDIDVFRATGGSLYYLRRGHIAEGSERVRVVVRERDNGLVLLENTLRRDVDYTIDAAQGRFMTKEPIAGAVPSTLPIANLDDAQTPLGGNPVFLEVSYEYEPDAAGGGAAGGAYLSESVLFGKVTFGAGVVADGRRNEGPDDYRLLGVNLAVHPTNKTTISAELARSWSVDAGNFISQDGGLTFQGLNGVGFPTSTADSGGVAWRIALDSELDLAATGWTGRPRIHLYAQDVDRQFSSQSTVLDQGRLKVGGQVTIQLDAGDTLTVGNDSVVARLPRVGPTPAVVAANPDPLALDDHGRYLTRVVWRRAGEGWGLIVEGAHQRTTQPLADADRFGLGAVLSRPVSRELTFRLGQEFQWTFADIDPVLAPIAGGARPGREDGNGLAGVATHAGADWRLAPDFTLSGDVALRWNGDTSAIAGLKTPVGDDASMYISQRLDERAGRLLTTSVVGGAQRLGGATAYGEYQIASGVDGPRNRAVLGVGHRWALAPGWDIALGYEHQQTLGGFLPDGTPTGRNSRDVLHLASEYLRPRRLKASASFEIRLDDGLSDEPDAIRPEFAGLVLEDPRGVAPPGTYPDHGGPLPGEPLVLPPGQRVQVVAGLGADWRSTDDHTLFGRVVVSNTEDESNPESFTVARFIEATAGWAYRPLSLDWLDLVSKYTFLLEMRPDEPEGRSHVLTFAPVIDLPLGLSLSAKLAWKRTIIDDSAVSTLLWLTRIGWRFQGRWDVAAEVRLLEQDDTSEDGFLLEVDYNLDRRVRLGAGYNFSHFSDDELADLTHDSHGPFIRVVARY